MLVTDRKTDYFEKRAGGTGTTIMEHIIDESIYGGKIAAYARVILKPGCSLGYHKHEGTSETLYILSGTAEYNDNGTETELFPGDVAYTVPRRRCLLRRRRKPQHRQQRPQQNRFGCYGADS